MGRPVELSVAEELGYVRRALAELDLRLVDVAGHAGCALPTVSNWIAGRKRPPAGLFFTVLACLTPCDRAVLLGWVAESHRAGTVVSLAERRRAMALRAAAAAYVDDAPERTPLETSDRRAA